LKYNYKNYEIQIQGNISFYHIFVFRHPSPQNGIDWPKYYTINNKIITPYYEITNEPKPKTNFDIGLKINECEYLWKTYIDHQFERKLNRKVLHKKTPK